MSAGRPRNPKKIKEMRGTDDKRWISENEPQFDLIIGEDAPEFLTDGAKDIWDHVANDLMKVGILQSVDVLQLASYCSLMDIYHKCLKEVNEKGWESESGKRTSPSSVTMFRAHEAAMKVAARFGFTPSDRAKLDISPPSKSIDPLDTV